MATRRRPFDPQITAAISAAAQRHGLSVQALTAFARIESGGNPRVVTGSYQGLFQLSQREFSRFGGGDIFSPADNANAAAAKLRNEAAGFEKQWGRAPSASELYMMHQQGVGGSRMHWQNPDRPAWQNMAATGEGRQKGERWARQAIWGNIPRQERAQFGSVDNVTSRQFTGMWDRLMARQGGLTPEQASAPITATQVAAAAQTPTVERTPGTDQFEATRQMMAQTQQDGLSPATINTEQIAAGMDQPSPVDLPTASRFAEPRISPDPFDQPATAGVTQNDPVTTTMAASPMVAEAFPAQGPISMTLPAVPPPPPTTIAGETGKGGGGFFSGGEGGGGRGFKMPTPRPVQTPTVAGAFDDPLQRMAMFEPTREDIAGDKMFALPPPPPRTPAGMLPPDILGRRNKKRGRAA